MSRRLRRGGYAGRVEILQGAYAACLTALPAKTMVFAAGNIARDGKTVMEIVQREGERLV